MKNYICLALYASAIPALTIFQNYSSGNLISSIYLFSPNNGLTESLFTFLRNTTWEPIALVCVLLFAIMLRWFFYSKSQKRYHSKAENNGSLDEERELQEKQQSVRFEKEISEPEWERFEVMIFSSFPKLKQALVSSREILPPVEVRICCLMLIETSQKDICTLIGINQDMFSKHVSHLRQCLNIPLSQSLDSYILTSN